MKCEMKLFDSLCRPSYSFSVLKFSELKAREKIIDEK
jgi:hypothetical protein